MAMSRRMLALLMSGGLVLAGCSASPVGSPSPGVETPTAVPTPITTPVATPQPTPGADGIILLQASVPRATATAADAARAASAVNAFGLDLFSRVVSSDSNSVVSPASIALALGMARAGAVGTTAAEMDSVLHDVASPANAALLNALSQALASRSATYEDPEGVARDVTLRIANAPFVQEGMNVQQAYLDALASLYGAGLRLVDYAGDPEGSRQLINAWVAAQTEQRIKELLAAGDIGPQTRIALVNAIYLQAPWTWPFDEHDTKPATFTRADGSKVSVPLMQGMLLARRYAEGDGWQAVELPFLGGTMAMTLILPDDLASFEAGLDADRFAGIVSQLDYAEATVELPRFSIRTHASLVQALQALGMTTAFGPQADFSGITHDLPLQISDVIHEATIDVDEAGTIATAATAVTGLGGAGEPPKIYDVRLDHPFLFALRDLETGTVLFLGHVVDPSVGAGGD
jgi:serpin B